jgi:hypothetical protein
MNDIPTRKATPKEQAYINALYSLTKTQEQIIKDYDIEFWHSGGGCRHLAYQINVFDDDDNKLMWLINDLQEFTNSKDGKKYYDHSADVPTSEDQFCIFGLWFGDCDYKLREKIERSLKRLTKNQELQVEVLNDEQFCLYDNLKSGVVKMKEISKYLEKLTEEK